MASWVVCDKVRLKIMYKYACTYAIRKLPKVRMHFSAFHLIKSWKLIKSNYEQSEPPYDVNSDFLSLYILVVTYVLVLEGPCKRAMIKWCQRATHKRNRLIEAQRSS